jgi:hypothetical protein
MHHAWTILAAGVLALCGATASAQSLGDVAKKEEARRKTVKAAGKVYTNEDVQGGPGQQPPPPPSQAAGAQLPPPASGAQGAAPESKDASAEDPKKTEAFWRGRMDAARAALERARMFRDALQSRVNALGNDFAARDDPAQRNQIAGDRQKALAEMDRVQKEIADGEKAIRDIEEEARRAGVPPGWIR